MAEAHTVDRVMPIAVQGRRRPRVDDNVAMSQRDRNGSPRSPPLFAKAVAVLTFSYMPGPGVSVVGNSAARGERLTKRPRSVCPQDLRVRSSFTPMLVGKSRDPAHNPRPSNRASTAAACISDSSCATLISMPPMPITSYGPCFRPVPLSCLLASFPIRILRAPVNNRMCPSCPPPLLSSCRDPLTRRRTSSFDVEVRPRRDCDRNEALGSFASSARAMHCAVSWEYVPGPTRRGVEGDDTCVKSAVSGKRFSVGHVEGLVGGLAAELIAGFVETDGAECGPGRGAEDPCITVAPQGAALFAECDAAMERPARGCGCRRERGCGAGAAVTVRCTSAIDEAPMSTTAVAAARSIGDVTAYIKTGEFKAFASTEAFAARVAPASVLACEASVPLVPALAIAEHDAVPGPAGLAPGVAAVLCLGVTESEADVEVKAEAAVADAEAVAEAVAEAAAEAAAEAEAEVGVDAGGSSAEARARCRSLLSCDAASGKEAGAALPCRGRTL